MMDDITSNIKVWLADCLPHTRTENDLLTTLNFFFNKWKKYGLKLYASKHVLFETTMRYCGRLIAKDGVHFDQKKMKALQTMCEPQNGADLVEYVAAVNWMRIAILNNSKRVKLLQAALAKMFDCKAPGQRKLQPQRRCYAFMDQSKLLSKIYKQL
jgi:hypothetical protein